LYLLAFNLPQYEPNLRSFIHFHLLSNALTAIISLLLHLGLATCSQQVCSARNMLATCWQHACRQMFLSYNARNAV